MIDFDPSSSIFNLNGSASSPDVYILKLNQSLNVGINMNNEPNYFNVYPNPTTKKITIDLGEVRTDLKAILTNSLGQVVLTKHYTCTNIVNLDLNYPKGIYFLSLESHGELISKKIVIE